MQSIANVNLNRQFDLFALRLELLALHERSAEISLCSVISERQIKRYTSAIGRIFIGENICDGRTRAADIFQKALPRLRGGDAFRQCRVLGAWIRRGAVIDHVIGIGRICASVSGI